MRRKRPDGPIIVRDDGTFTINLQDHERETMLDLVGQLETVLVPMMNAFAGCTQRRTTRTQSMTLSIKGLCAKS
jgi:hypothetical protein